MQLSDNAIQALAILFPMAFSAFVIFVVCFSKELERQEEILHSVKREELERARRQGARQQEELFKAQARQSLAAWSPIEWEAEEVETVTVSRRPRKWGRHHA